MEGEAAMAPQQSSRQQVLILLNDGTTPCELPHKTESRPSVLSIEIFFLDKKN
jgi:hypothetical protein